MSTLPASEKTNNPRLDPRTRLGHVHLVVNSLEQQIAFYTQVLGFQLHWRAEAEAALGTRTEILLRLSEDPAARRSHNTTGMYHFAVLYPSRKELARAIARLFALRYTNYPTDHGISKTTYLDDPEGNNIELYVRSLDDAVFEVVEGQMVVRYADGRIGSGRDPLDLQALFRELDDSDRLDEPLPEGTQIGHVHLYAASLGDSLDFYAGVLGFAEGPLIESFRMGEVGLGDEQPHVVAFNTWKGEGIPPAPDGAQGLRHFTIVFTDEQARQQAARRVQVAGLPVEAMEEGLRVRDPSGIAVVLSERMLLV